MSSYFPDINVWIALTYSGHQHHKVATAWFGRAHSDSVGFCRLTQLGFLRLLTHPSVMGDEVRTQQQAWKAYDLLAEDWRVVFHPEADPEEINEEFRAITETAQSSPQQWPDAYLVAFARVAGLTLVTFDRALGQLAGHDALLLN